jgi:RNA polymerase sigma-70 factor (ECF subfamily)
MLSCRRLAIAALPVSLAAMGGEESSDEALMLRYRDGDADSFDLLYARHKDALFRYCLRHCRERGSAEETFQDVWMRVIGSRRRYEARAKFTTWLYRIAHNRVIDGYRSSQSNPIQSLDDGPSAMEPAAKPGDEPDRRASSDQQAARLQGLLAELPAEQRDTFLLHEEAGLALETIAELSGVGRETVKSRLRYALSKLRAALKDEQ